MNITIINDDFMESNESFVISLASGPEVILSPYAWTKIIIYDDDVDMNENNDGKGMGEFLIMEISHSH